MLLNVWDPYGIARPFSGKENLKRVVLSDSEIVAFNGIDMDGFAGVVSICILFPWYGAKGT